VTQWWKDNVGTQDEQSYTKQVIERFEKDDSLSC
jgi:type I restriction enzyme R subunit